MPRQIRHQTRRMNGEKAMKYCVIGAGGTGGCIAAYMSKAGKDVTVIARGAHLVKMQEQGLCLARPDQEDEYIAVRATDMGHYAETPDVIFVCVKGYSLADTVPFIRRVAGTQTIVIPILNIYGTGGRLQKELPDILVTDGCIYVASQISEPGKIQMNGSIFRIVYGVREPEELRRELFIVKQDLEDSGIEAILSDQIRRDALQKFSYVSPMAAAGLYYDADASRFQKTGDERDLFVALMKEIDALAEAMGIPFQIDIVRNNLAILDSLAGNATTSMQRDIAAGKDSEIDGLIREVVRLGRQYRVPTPMYEMIAQKVCPER